MTKVNISQIGNIILKNLEQYTEDVEKGIEKEKVKIARKSVSTLKSTSPVGRTGDYKKSWRYVKRKGVLIVHSRDHYRLTHLLEKGHALPQGGRTKPQPHIKPVELTAIQEFEDAVERVVRES